MHRRKRLLQVKNSLPIAGYICTILPSQIYGDVREPLMSYKTFILSYSILFYLMLFYPLTLSYPILFFLILSCPILSCPILFCPILSCHILPYLILSYAIISYPPLSYPLSFFPSFLLSCLIFVTVTIFPFLCPLGYFFYYPFFFILASTFSLYW